MRVCIPIEFRPHGGGFFFLEHFSRYLIANGHEVIQSTRSSCDVLFTNSWMTPYLEIQRSIFHNPDVRIVHRIDGSAENYGRDPEADRQQSIVNQLADLTVFQSEYARYSTREKFPVIAQDGPIIFNPVDLDVFTPHGAKTAPGLKPRVACVTWSTNPMKGKQQIYAVIAKNPNVEFALCGNFDDAPAFQNVEIKGVLNRLQLAHTLRSCQALMTFSRNEACPNHVLEALASGLPVLYRDSGAMREVVGDAGLPITEETFAEQLDKVILQSQVFSSSARQRAELLFHPEKNFGLYLDAIYKVLCSPHQKSLFGRRVRAATALLSSKIGRK